MLLLWIDALHNTCLPILHYHYGAVVLLVLSNALYPMIIQGKLKGRGLIFICNLFNPLAPELFFLILAHPVYKI